VDGDARFGIERGRNDVAQQHQHQEPELRPLVEPSASRSSPRGWHNRTPPAVFSGQIAFQSIEVAGCHPHGKAWQAGYERRLTEYYLLFQWFK